MPRNTRKRRPLLLVFSQTYSPDPAAVGQYVADAAAAMAARGHRVRVYTANRGYEDPTRRYPRRENLHGVDVRRLPLSSFGKRSILTRIIGTLSFLLQCTVIGLFTPNVAGILFSTSPPMIGFAATWVGILRGIPGAYWAMDLNPDQLIAMGKLRPGSLRVRLLEAVNRFILRRAAVIFALDRFMAGRLLARGDFARTLRVDPPWPREHVLAAVPRETNPFRLRHNLQDKFVVMYSGNHSPANPLDTLIQAAIRRRDDTAMAFVFVGGGAGKRQVQEAVDQHHLSNVHSLPYQPLEELKYSLAAADVHVVALGDPMVGIIHPCKIYGAMAVGRPVLYLGPRPSHVSDLLDAHGFGWQVAHGDATAMDQALSQMRDTPAADLARMGRKGQEVLHEMLSQSVLSERFCAALEEAFPRLGAPSTAARDATPARAAP